MSASSPIGSSTKRGMSRCAVVSPVTIVPGAAAAWSRAATFVMSPSATAWGVAAPTTPTAARPPLIPMRTLNWSISQAWRTSRPYAPTIWSSASPASAARSASSSWAAGTPK